MSNKNVLITGCSSGIGLLTAITAARAGHHVWASMRLPNARNQSAANELFNLAQAEGLHVDIVDLDVAQSGCIEQVISEAAAQGRSIDVLVNNAGIMPIDITEGFTLEQLQVGFDTNFFGPVRLCRAVLPQMRKRRSGLIVHVSSKLGRVLFPFCGIYCASKFALEAFAEVLHYKLNGLGIGSVLVEPGPYPKQLLANSPVLSDLACVQEWAVGLVTGPLCAPIRGALCFGEDS